MLVRCEQLEARQLLAAAVVTDKPDYAPGSTAHITASNDGNPGANFQAGETIEFKVIRTDGVQDYPPGNQPWDVTAGADGSVTTDWYVNPQYAGASLELTATGLTSGAVAKTDFTDSTGPVTIATAGNTTSSTTLQSSAFSQAVAVNNTLLVTIAMDPNAGTVSVADSKGNTFTKDADVTNGSGTSGVRTLIFSAPVTT